MKAFLVGILFVIVVGVAAYIGLRYFYTSPTGTGSNQTYQTAPITKTGQLRKSNITNSDFTHVIVSAGQSIGVASYTLNLDDYIGKQVSVTGQFSGTTLYADKITVLQ